MNEIVTEIDLTQTSLDRLKELRRWFRQMQRHGGGYSAWLTMLDRAIKHAKSNKKRTNND